MNTRKSGIYIFWYSALSLSNGCIKSELWSSLTNTTDGHTGLIARGMLFVALKVNHCCDRTSLTKIMYITKLLMLAISNKFNWIFWCRWLMHKIIAIMNYVKLFTRYLFFNYFDSISNKKNPSTFPRNQNATLIQLIVREIIQMQIIQLRKRLKHGRLFANKSAGSGWTNQRILTQFSIASFVAHSNYIVCSAFFKWIANDHRVNVIPRALFGWIHIIITNISSLMTF